MRQRLVLALALAGTLTACGSSPGHELLGDAAVADGRWAVALEAYAEAGSDPRVLGKRATTALEAGRPGAAALAFAELAARDSTRIAEAAAGLARAARMAHRDGDMLSLATAVRGLREIAPTSPLGRLALPLRLVAFPSDQDVIALAPAILSAAPARDVADEALVTLAQAWRRQGRCDRAAPLYDALSRRLGDSTAVMAAREFAACRLEAGLAAIASEGWDSARTALGDAVNRDPGGAVGRRALVALGDVHFQMGDHFAAQLAWRTVAAGAAASDSITALALERLRAATSSDSTGIPGIPQ